MKDGKIRNCEPFLKLEVTAQEIRKVPDQKICVERSENEPGEQ